LLISVLKILGLLVLVLLAFVGVDYGETLEVLSEADLALVLAAFALLNLALLMRAFRWEYLARRSGLIYERRADYYAVFYSAWLAQFVLPQGVSSAARLAMVAEGGGRSLGKGLAAVLVERVTDVISTALIGLVMIAWVIENGQAETFAVVGAVVCLGVVCAALGLVLLREVARSHGDRLMARWPILRRAFVVVDDALAAVVQMGPRTVALMSIYSVITGILLATALYVASLALDLDVPYTLMVAAWAVINLALSLPISVLGFGPREGILVVALAGSGEAEEAGVALGLLWFALLALSRVPGVIGWFHKPVVVPDASPTAAPS
jgi:glycosyltransferase 2 family protein